MDPVTHFSQSPYVSMDADPINLFDPWGADSQKSGGKTKGSGSSKAGKSSKSGKSSGSSGSGSGKSKGDGSGSTTSTGRSPSGKVTTPNGYGADFAADWFSIVLGNLVMTNGFDYQVWNSGTGFYEYGREPRTWTGTKSLEEFPYEQAQVGDTYEQELTDPYGVNYATGISGDSHILLYIGDYQWIELKGYSSYKSAEYATFFFPLGGGVRLGSKLLNWLSKFYAGKRVISGVRAFSRAVIPKSIHMGKQGKHVLGHNNYTDGKSILHLDSQSLLDTFHAGKYKILRTFDNKVIVDFGKDIGTYYNKSGQAVGKTRFGTIHYGKNGAHIVPANPKQF